jgi:L-lactate dehydrogenase complex protein LldG
MSSRERILGAVRAGLEGTAVGRDPAAVEARLAAHAPGLIPARGQLDAAGRLDLFIAMAEEVSTSVTRVGAMAEVPAAIAGYLAEHNIAPIAKIAPDPVLDAIPWQAAPLLDLTRGKGEDADKVSITSAFAGIAETGTVMALSGPHHPTTLNILPETHVVVLRADQIVGAYEEAWDRLRASGRGTPRTIMLITGPSRSGDIEQTIQLGAHGPKRLHLVIVDAPS